MTDRADDRSPGGSDAELRAVLSGCAGGAGLCRSLDPLILRELCFGVCTFGELLSAMPLISRTMLVQRLKELAHAEVVVIEAKTGDAVICIN